MLRPSLAGHDAYQRRPPPWPRAARPWCQSRSGKRVTKESRRSQLSILRASISRPTLRECIRGRGAEDSYDRRFVVLGSAVILLIIEVSIGVLRIDRSTQFCCVFERALEVGLVAEHIVQFLEFI